MFSVSSKFELFVLPSVPSVDVDNRTLSPLPVIPIPQVFAFVIYPGYPPGSKISEFGPKAAPYET